MAHSTLMQRILFLPGHMCDERLYAPQLAALSTSFDCQVMVFREEHSLSQMAERILDTQPDRFTCVGLSMGGYLAMELLRQAPHRLLRLALLDTRASPDTAAQKAARLEDRAKVASLGMKRFSQSLPARFLAPGHVTEPGMAGVTMAMAEDLGPQVHIAQQNAMIGRPDSFAALAQLACPSLVVCGRQDRVTTVADHEAMVAAIRAHRSDCEFYVIEDCGHMATLEQPSIVNQLLLNFLSG
jgi:pimeloyl-ACP methyl ester carboxylesterase